MLPQLVGSRIAIAFGTLAFTAMLACAANGALAKESVITRASYVSGGAPNAPAILLIHGRFAAGHIPGNHILPQSWWWPVRR